MSDSDEDLTENNMFQNENTLLHGQGSFLNNRFKNIVPSTYKNTISSQNISHGYGYNQRSIYHRRETSPMSLQSVPDFGQHNFDNSYYGRGRTFARSVLNGRSQSPGSVGSMDSTTSAAYVAQIFKNMKFNKYDKRIINEAYNKYFRKQARRRIGKRRKLKLFLKHNRRKSGDDSGDEGSNSSMSSDDNKSVRSTIPKESILRPSNRSNRTEILNFRATMKESDMYKDCTENLKHSTLKNMFSGHNIRHTIQEKTCNTITETEEKRDYNTVSSTKQQKANNGIIGTQKERFTKGFMLPSQRFNKPVVNPKINGSVMSLSTEVCSQRVLAEAKSDDNAESENEEIFPNQTIKEKENTTICRKRALENNDTIVSDYKRNKLSPNNLSTLRDDLTFKKPQMPVRRQIKTKTNFLSEQIISKSSHPLMNNFGHPSFLSQSINQDRLNISHPNRKLNGFLNIRNTVHKKTENNPKAMETDSDTDEIFPQNILNNNNLKNILAQQISNQIDERDKNDNKIISPKKTKKNKTSNIKKYNTKKSSKELPDPLPEEEKYVDIPTKKVNAEKQVICTSPTKTSNTEKLISKSSQPLTGNVEIINPIPSNSQPQSIQSNTEKGIEVNASEMPLSTSDVSMKPSFIKRKLFTQKLDIAEDKKLSDDSVSTNSPQTRNYRFREKNKVRKLATSQSCLSRDVLGEENILDLIHKIVPADQINMTSVSNQRTLKSIHENENKWDITSVISMCNASNESDTFTDEDIFNVNKTNKQKSQASNKSKKIVENKKCVVVVKKLSQDIDKPQCIPDVNKTNCATKRTVASVVRAFWDTDFETDVEDGVQTPMKPSTNTLGQFREREASKKSENTSKPKETLLSSNKNKINNTLLRKFPSECSAEEKSVNKGDVNKASTNRLPKDKNIQEHAKTGPTRRTIKNVTENEVTSLKETKKNTCKPKLLEETKNKIKTQNNLKLLEPKNKEKITAKNDTKFLNKDELKEPTKDSAKSVQEENKTVAKTLRKQTRRVKEIKSYLNDSLNSSTSDLSILRRSFRLGTKQQINATTLNQSNSTPKPKSKSTRKYTPKRTPLPNNKMGSNKKQTTETITKNARTTPTRKAKVKNNFSILNVSVSTRNRSLNTSLKAKPQQRNIKRPK